MLDPQTLARRITSARELRGISQAEVGEAMVAHGFGKHDAARIERRHPKAPQFTPGRRHALATILTVPERWFTAADDALFVEAGANERVAQIERRVEVLWDVIRQDLAPLAGLDPVRLEQLVDAADQAPTGETKRTRTRKRREE